MSHCVGGRFSRPAITEETPFDPCLPHFSTTVDPWLSSATSSQGNANGILSDTQSMDLSSAEYMRASYAASSAMTMDGSRIDKYATYPSQSFTQYPPTFEPSSFWNDAVLGTDTWDSNQLEFDMTPQNDSLSGFIASPDLQSSGPSSQELPVITFSGDVSNGDFDYDSTYGSLISPNFSESNSTESNLKEYFVAASEQGGNGTVRTNTEPFADENYKNTAYTLSPNSRCRLNIDSFQDALKGIEPGMTCMTLALKILQTLHIPRSVCMHAYDGSTAPRPPHQPRMVDSVLSICRNIVPLVSDMLQCACSLNVQVQLIITNICGKLMSWYRAMMRNDQHHHSGRLDENPSSSNKTRRSTPANKRDINHRNSKSAAVESEVEEEDHPVRVSRQTITIGHYAFDVALEGKVLAELVSSELQHLESLVQDLAKRMRESRFGEIFMDKASRGASASPWADGESSRSDQTMTGRGAAGNGSTTTTGKLSAFLSEQMRAVKEEIGSYTRR